MDLSNLEPRFGKSIQNFLDDLNKQYASQGITFQPVSGYRSQAEQKALYDAYAAGKAKGLPDTALVKAAPPGQSWHNWGGATDIMPFRNGVQLSNAEATPILNTIGPTASKYGMVWGGGFNDLDHFQAGPSLGTWLDTTGRRNWKGPETPLNQGSMPTVNQPTQQLVPGSQTPAASTGHFNLAPGLEEAIQAAVAKNPGVSADYLRTIAMIESNGGRNLKSPLSSAKGPFQFIDSTAAKYGLTNPMDFNASADAAARLALDNKGALERLLGRPVNDAELYLAHQQGTSSTHALLGNPDRLAKDMLPYKAIVNNIPKGSGYSADTITAKQLADLWLGKYSSIAGGTGGTSSSPAPVASGGGGGTPQAETPRTPGDTSAPVSRVQQTPEQAFSSSLGQALASIGNTIGGGGGGGNPGANDPIDAPPIRMPGLNAAQAPLAPDARPAQYQGLGSQLASLSAQGQPILADPEANPLLMGSITQGAPGMSALLGTMGTPSTFNYTDQRSAQPIPNTLAGATRGVRFA